MKNKFNNPNFNPNFQWQVVSFHELQCGYCGEIFDIMKNEVERFKHCPACGHNMEKEDEK